MRLKEVVNIEETCVSAASSEPASVALGHLGAAVKHLLGEPDPTGRNLQLALLCLEAASDLADAGVEPAPIPQLRADAALRQAASILARDERAELRADGHELLVALARGT